VDRASLLLFIEEGPKKKKRLLSLKDCYSLIVRNTMCSLYVVLRMHPRCYDGVCRQIVGCPWGSF